MESPSLAPGSAKLEVIDAEHCKGISCAGTAQFVDSSTVEV